MQGTAGISARGVMNVDLKPKVVVVKKVEASNEDIMKEINARLETLKTTDRIFRDFKRVTNEFLTEANKVLDVYGRIAYSNLEAVVGRSEMDSFCKQMLIATDHLKVLNFYNKHAKTEYVREKFGTLLKGVTDNVSAVLKEVDADVLVKVCAVKLTGYIVQNLDKVGVLKELSEAIHDVINQTILKEIEAIGQ